MKEDDFDKVIEVNLKGTFNCIRHVSPVMLKQRSGKIINISSVVGITGNAGQVNYSAAKAGIIGITKSTARELASRGINVNAVAPGFIDTDMTKNLSEKVKENALHNIPLKRFGTVYDVANAVSFLASSNSDYITGQIINIDGGMVM
jgi:3-oxoacyl-[acyl-carrier protein] reductase